MRDRSFLRGRPPAGALFFLPLLAACNQAPAEPASASPASPAAAPIDAAARAAQASELRAAIAPQVDRSPGVGKITARAGGARHADLGGSYQSFVIAKVNDDGSRSTTCVDDEAEAEAFWKSGDAPAARGGDR
jgi:hypothetical protein